MIIINDTVGGNFYNGQFIVKARKHKSSSDNKYCVNLFFLNNESINNKYNTEALADAKLIEIKNALKSNSNTIIDI